MRPLFLCDDCSPEPIAQLAIEHACGIEIQSFYDPTLLDRHPDAIERHCRILEKFPREKRSLHGPYGDLCPGSFDPAVRELARNRFELGYDRCCDLDISRMILHHGYVPGTSHPPNYTKRSVAFWRDFLADKPADLFVHLENMHEHTPDMIAELIAGVNDPRLTACLDTGHTHCHGMVPTVEWIRTLGPMIGYVHLHDNHGETDEHLPLGQGTLPVAEVLAALTEHSPAAVWALEVGADGMSASLAFLRSHSLLK